MKPLAYRLRPKSFDQVVGQDHLVSKQGIITKMLNQKHLMSFILHGNPGTGKTTIALITAENASLNYFHFNASVDNKADLKRIIDQTVFGTILIIIDEIHRMKTDIQDYLLPFLESGEVIIIGITTANPYRAVNVAIRSRCHIYEVSDLSIENIKLVLRGALNSDDVSYDGEVNHDVIHFIAETSNLELRTALNRLETVLIYGSDLDQISLTIAQRALNDPRAYFSSSEIYDLLSAFQKSIRGSDVDASLHYLARLIVYGDLDLIIRRLLVIVYEDIGLANPTLGQKVLAACEAALKVGFPEAQIPLSVAVIDAAISPKSNTAYEAISNALNVLNNTTIDPIPKHILNTEIRKDSTIYKYPHDYKNSLVKQQYLPNNIKDHIYYKPKDESKYESLLKQRLEQLKKITT